MVMTLLTRPKKTVATVVIATDGSGDFNTDGTDDDVEINAALNSLPADGGCVYMKEGVYDITNPIVIPYDDISIIGCGHSTQIQTTANINMIEATNVDYITIEKIYILGSAVAAANRGMSLDNISYSIINKCWFENTGFQAIYLNDSEYNVISENHMNDCDYGIYLETATPGLADYNIIVSNIIDGSTWDGIQLRFSSNNLIQGNKISNNVGEGIDSFHGDHDIISNNEVYSNTKNGIYLYYDCYNNTVEGNFVYDNDVDDTATYDGIIIGTEILGPCANNIISTNRCMDNDRNEIYIDTQADRTLVTGNICIGTDHVATIVDNGTNNQIFNNLET